MQSADERLKNRLSTTVFAHVEKHHQDDHPAGAPIEHVHIRKIVTNDRST